MIPKTQIGIIRQNLDDFQFVNVQQLLGSCVWVRKRHLTA